MSTCRALTFCGRMHPSQNTCHPAVGVGIPGQQRRTDWRSQQDESATPQRDRLMSKCRNHRIARPGIEWQWVKLPDLGTHRPGEIHIGDVRGCDPSMLESNRRLQQYRTAAPEALFHYADHALVQYARAWNYESRSARYPAAITQRNPARDSGKRQPEPRLMSEPASGYPARIWTSAAQAARNSRREMRILRTCPQ